MAEGHSSAETHPAPVRILGISGSLRRASCNTGLLRACARLAPSLNATLEIADLSEIPVYNGDLEAQGIPESVQRLKELITSADAILFSTPEYNYSFSGALKNAIDWVSRPTNVLNNKVAAIISAGGGAGGARAQYHLRQVFVFLNVHLVNKPEVMVQIFTQPSPFDLSTGDLVHIQTEERLVAVLQSLIDLKKRF